MSFFQSATAKLKSRFSRHLELNPVIVIAAGAQVEVLLSHTTDRGQLERALNEIQVGRDGADMPTALELAAAIAGGEPEAEIVILSDGGGRMPTHLSSTATVHYFPVGSSGENQAISALALDTGGAGQALSAFARVTNYGHQPVERRMTLHTHGAPFDPGDGTLITARDLTLPAGESVALTLPDLPADIVAVEARLDGEDALALDDTAWAVAPVRSGAQIQIVGPGNRFLELGLSLLPGVEVTTISLEAYEGLWAEPDAAEPEAQWLTIFDTVLPEAGHYPPGALFFIGPLRSTEFFSVTGEVELVAPRPASAGEPLLEYVDLRDVVVERAARIPLPDWGRPVIVAGGAEDAEDPPSLLIAGEAGGRPHRRLRSRSLGQRSGGRAGAGRGLHP